MKPRVQKTAQKSQWALYFSLIHRGEYLTAQRRHAVRDSAHWGSTKAIGDLGVKASSPRAGRLSDIKL